jgi:hypothetical protein
MGQTDGSNSRYFEINGVKVHLHKPESNASFVKDCCGYDPEETRLRNLDKQQKGKLSEHAGRKYAEAQGYERICPEAQDIDPSTTGVDVVAFDPVTREVVVVETKTQKRSTAWDAKNKRGPWNTERLNSTVEDRALNALESKGDIQLGPEYINRDNEEKLTEISAENEPGEDTTRDLHPRTYEGVEQTYGEVVGYRREYVGVQIGTIEEGGPPVEDNFGDPDIDMDRVVIVQIPEAESEHSLQESPNTPDVDPKEAFGVSTEQYMFDPSEISERRKKELTSEERRRYERLITNREKRDNSEQESTEVATGETERTSDSTASDPADVSDPDSFLDTLNTDESNAQDSISATEEEEMNSGL